MTPVAAWFVYSLVVGVLMSASAWLAEAALRAAGRPGRWAWVTAMLATVVLPLLAVLGTMEWARAVPTAPMVVIPLAPLAVSVESASPGVSLDRVLLLFWVSVAVGIVLYLWRTHRQLVRGVKGEPTRLDGIGVYVTEGVGPAVFGLRRARILVPRWALGLETRLRRFMLLHEGEHARAGDGQLALAALLLPAAVPWNLPLWFQLKRLRSAIELDCDERVLRRVPDRLGYGGLLLEVGRRRSGLLLGVAMAERRTLLEERLRRISAVAGRPNVRRALWLSGVASVLLAVAVCTRDPLTTAAPAADPAQSVVALGERPVFTPFTRAPQLLNREETARALEQNYPPLLRQAGIGGKAEMWFFIDATGAVRNTELQQTTGYPALDEAAARVASAMRFSPAYNRDKAVPVWVSIPIVFRTADESASVAAPEGVSQSIEDTGLDRELKESLNPGAQARDRSVLENGPVFTPFTRAPRLMNREETARALEQNYPPLLRDAGIGGTVKVWFLIDEGGRVVKTQLQEASAYPALDEAALRVANQIEFTPAYNRDEPVMVWVEIPIAFNVK